MAAARITSTAHGAVRLPRAQRREQIVRAAAAVFLAAGYEKSSMEDVARAAGVTRLIVYRIFESKAALYLAVLTTVLDELAERFEPGAGPVEQERHEPVASVLLRVARAHPDGFRLLWRHTANQAEFSGLYAMFQEAANEYATTVIAPVLGDPVIVRWAAASLVSTIYESICLWLDDGDARRDDQFLRMLTEGIRATVQTWAASAHPGAEHEGEHRRE